MKKLRIGIVGLGVGVRHFEAYRQHPQCEVVAVCDFSEDKLNKISRDHAYIRRSKSAQDILAARDIDLVSIASFDNYHFEQTVTALQHNKHVFVEKPLCLTPAEAYSIRSLMQKNESLQLSSNLTLRTCPRFQELKNSIHTGKLGEIYHLEGDYLWGRIYKLLNGWRKDMPFYSIIHGAAIHMIDLIIWLIEDLPVEVYGCGNNIATRKSDFQYNDFAVLLITFSNGTIAKISANGGCIHPHFHKLIVYGTKQTFTHEWPGAQIISSGVRNETSEPITTEYPGNRQKDIIHSFVDSILYEDSKPLAPAAEIFDTLSVCFAAEESVRQAKPMKIEYIS